MELGGPSTHGTHIQCFVESSFPTVLQEGRYSEQTSSVLCRKLEENMFCTSSWNRKHEIGK